MNKMPTIEDAIELSGIDVLHPGGYDLTKRIAEVTDIRGKNILDVASGRGASACYYAKNYSARVTGVDINPEMVRSAVERAKMDGVDASARFETGDALALPFADNTFDAAINECAVGLISDPQLCLKEMARVVKPGGDIVIHESTWLRQVPAAEKQDVSRRLGTVPHMLYEWVAMMKNAGLTDIWTEDWSDVEKSIVKMRSDRSIKRLEDMYTFREKYLVIFPQILRKFGLRGLLYLDKSNKMIIRLYYDGTLGYYLIKGKKPA
ncbi:MAG: methyltransferase domain-containing protein [Methanocella sp.]